MTERVLRLGGVTAALATTAVAGVSLLRPPAADPGEPVVRWTAWAAIGWWAAATASPPGPLARVVYTLGWWQFVLHVALAFHLGHGWSHADAVARVEAVSGFGSGIWVSHLFLLAWTTDVAWMWLAPGGYRRRPPWVGWAVVGFQAFIVFNATVVYGSGPAKVFGLVAMGAIVTARLAARQR